MKISSVLKEHSKILSENALRWQPKILLCDYTRHFGRVFSATCQIVTQKTFISTLPQGIEDGGRPVFVVVKNAADKIFESLPNYYHNVDLSRTSSMMMICPCNLIMVQRQFSNFKYKLRTLNLKEFSFQT